MCCKQTKAKLRGPILAINLVIIGMLGFSCHMNNQDGGHSAANKESRAMSEKVYLPKGVFIRQRMSGGLIFREREWLFYTDGRIRHPDGKISRLKKENAEQLLEIGRRSGLADMAAEYPPPPGSADHVTMELTFRHAGSVKKIVAVDTNDQVPDRWWDYWQQLRKTAKESFVKAKEK